METNTSLTVERTFVIIEAVNASNGSRSNHSLLDSSSQEYNLFNINERLIFTILTSIILATLTLLTAVGNLFVMIAIWIDRNLRNVQNYLIFSLAFADLMVSCSVMPLGALYEVIGEWTLGTVLCDVWTSADVFCCTASILHLVAIALDRYWAVTNVEYIHRRTPTRILTLIACVWIGAIIVCIPPVFGLKDADFEHRVLVEKRCLYSQDIAYQVFATFTTFYGPVTLILLLYWKIYQVARKRIRNKPGNKMNAVHAKQELNPKKTFNGKSVAVIETQNTSLEPENGENLVLTDRSTSSPKLATRSDVETVDQTLPACDSNFNKAFEDAQTLKSKRKEAKEKEPRETKKEHKTAKILAIITGIFIVCWLPFFINALIMPFCHSCQSEIWSSIFLWLGYVNSLLNPVIYTIFSPDFRNAFRKMFGMRVTTRR